MSDQSKLQVSRKIQEDVCYLSFQGDIDEDFIFEELVGNGEKKFVIDFDKVSMINSCGIREWIQFVEKLDPNAHIIYMNCPQIIIQQMNMVEGFLTENAFVHSFYAPYYSEETDEEQSVLLKSEDIVDFKAPQMKDSEGNEMEFDAHEKQYFHFLNLQKQKAA